MSNMQQDVVVTAERGVTAGGTILVCHPLEVMQTARSSNGQ
jgi:hypothetical protein